MNNPRGAPYISFPEGVRSFMVKTIIPLMVVYSMAYFHYGPRVALLAGVTVLAAVLSDVAGILLFGGRPRLRDLSAVVTGMILPLLMPASVPLHIPVIAACFGILVAKHPFGGFGHNIFNPAAAGFAFAAICFPGVLFSYPTPNEWLPLFPKAGELMLQNSPAFTLNVGGIPQYETTALIMGNYPGPMGATNILVILACLLYLLFRGAVRWETPVFFLSTVAAFSWLAPRAAVSGLDSVIYEMTSGFLFFGGVFMLGDPVTSPIRGGAKMGHAVLAGSMVMLFRHAGNLEEGFIYALLALNATVWGFDLAGEKIAGILRRKRFETLKAKEVPKKA